MIENLNVIQSIWSIIEWKTKYCLEAEIKPQSGSKPATCLKASCVATMTWRHSHMQLKMRKQHKICKSVMQFIYDAIHNNSYNTRT